PCPQREDPFFLELVDGLEVHLRRIDEVAYAHAATLPLSSGGRPWCHLHHCGSQARRPPPPARMGRAGRGTVARARSPWRCRSAGRTATLVDVSRIRGGADSPARRAPRPNRPLSSGWLPPCERRLVRRPDVADGRAWTCAWTSPSAP